MHNVLLRKYVSIDFKMDSIMVPNIDGKNASVDAKIRWLSLSFIGFFGGVLVLMKGEVAKGL